MPTPNWFIALPVLAGPWFDNWEPPPAVRMFAKSDLHLTIAFLGAVSEERAYAAFELAAEFPLSGLDVSLGEVEALGSKQRPSAFSALLKRGRAEVERAMTSSRHAMWARAQAQPDSRPALAHITLARPSRKISTPDLQRAIAWARSLQLGEPVFRLDRIALYTWSEERQATLFRSVRELPLASEP